MSDTKTIFAPASAVGKSGVAVFRVSGADAKQAFLRLCDPPSLPAPRTAALRSLKHPITHEQLDRVLALYFPAPHSFTGEDVVEFHTHGGRAVGQAVVDALAHVPNFRMAEPGEFTRRAFENGKMDLTEAEAIADLIHAETEAQRKQALRQMGGALGKLYEDWRLRLSRSLAYMEAAIDFADDELPPDITEQQRAELRILRQQIGNHLADKRRGERLRDGFSIAILGPPNAGKSSLLNALAQREAAIVSPTAGTTRDVIDVHLDIDGFPVILADTAGLRDSHDEIENEGIRRAHERAAAADLSIVVFDGAIWPEKDEITRSLVDENSIVVVNKADLLGPDEPKNGNLFISVRNNVGIDSLLQTLAKEIDRRFSDEGGAPPLTRGRHRTALEECVSHLDRALAAPMADLRAEDVRMAMRALGRITGRVDVEDLLEIIFRDFCIGK
jgi:tRNA modification GTPase